MSSEDTEIIERFATREEKIAASQFVKPIMAHVTDADTPFVLFEVLALLATYYLKREEALFSSEWEGPEKTLDDLLKDVRHNALAYHESGVMQVVRQSTH